MAGIPVLDSLDKLRGVEAVYSNNTSADRPTVVASFDEPSGELTQRLITDAFTGVRMAALPLGNASYLTPEAAFAALQSRTNYTKFNVLSVTFPLNPCVSEPLFIFSVVEPTSPTGFVEIFVGAQSGAVCRSPVTRTVTSPASCEHGDEPKCFSLAG